MVLQRNSNGRLRNGRQIGICQTVLLNFVTEEDAMSKTALRCSAVLIASLALGAAAQAQTHESAIPNLASADFGWQHGLGLIFQRSRGRPHRPDVAPCCPVSSVSPMTRIPI